MRHGACYRLVPRGASSARNAVNNKPERRLGSIRLADGSGVADFFARALGAPHRYRRIVVCSPFIDEEGIRLLDRLQRRSQSGGRVDLVVSAADASEASSRWPGLRVIEKVGLHAKVYALLGFREADHFALVTSANLTAAGMSRNLELGLQVTGASEDLVRLIERIPARLD